MKKLFVCALAVAMVFAFTAPTMAADWNFYGSSRFATFSNDVDTRVAGVESDTDTQWAPQANARIGANVSGGDVGGRFEMSQTFGLRLLYGTWNFGAGKLLIGQDYSPIAEFYSNQVWGGDEDLLGNGMAYDGRQGQIKLIFGGFQVAFLSPVTSGNIGGAAVAAGTDIDTVLPKIALAYQFSTDMFSVKPYLGYQSYDVNTGTNEEAVTSLIYGLGGKVNFGPAYVAANVWGGTNAGNYGMAIADNSTTYGNGNAGMAMVNAAGGIEDATTMAYAAVIGFKASDMFTIEGGYGASNSETDFAGVKIEDDSNSYYINCTINMAPGVFIVPEFGKYSMDTIKTSGVSVDETEVTYFGAKWQINF